MCLLFFQLAEKLGLSHTSKGTGDDRFIVVSEPGQPITDSTTPYDKAVRQSDNGNDGDINENGEETRSKKKRKRNKKQNVELDENLKSEAVDPKEDGNDEENKVDEKENIEVRSDSGSSVVNQPTGATGSGGKVTCGTCGKDVIKANLQLHEIHCARKQKEAQNKTDESVKTKSKEVSKSSKHRQYDKELAERVEKVNKDDIDALIATVQNVDNFCCFKKCKTSVQTLFQVCLHCEGRFCLAHHIPEVHGCGDAARAAARARISKDGVLHRGSGVPERKVDSAKKAHIQRKMNSKMTELAAKRKGKPKK